MHDEPGMMAVGPHVPPPPHVPLQNGTLALSHGWLPSGTQPQYGSKSEIGSQVSSVDLVPTLLELAGVPSGPSDGASLLPLLDGREHGDRPAVIVGTDRGALAQLAVRQPPWKLILDVESGDEEAYRLDVDPRERVSRAAESPGELRELAFRELESAERRGLTEEEEATVARRLADLGYL